MNTLTQSFRAKYGDAYSDLSDDQLTKLIADKFPVYLDDAGFAADVARINGDDTTAAGAFTRGAATGVLPGAGAAAGAIAGGYLGTLGGPAAPITIPLGAFIGGLLGGLGVSTAQHAMLTDEFKRTLEHDAQKHGWAAMAGNVASSLPSFVLSPGSSLSKLATVAKGGATVGQAVEAVAPLALGAGTAAGIPLVQGRIPTIEEVVGGAAQAVLFGKPRFGGGRAPATAADPAAPAPASRGMTVENFRAWQEAQKRGINAKNFAAWQEQRAAEAKAAEAPAVEPPAEPPAPSATEIPTGDPFAKLRAEQEAAAAAQAAKDAQPKVATKVEPPKPLPTPEEAYRDAMEWYRAEFEAYGKAKMMARDGKIDEKALRDARKSFNQAKDELARAEAALPPKPKPTAQGELPVDAKAPKVSGGAVEAVAKSEQPPAPTPVTPPKPVKVVPPDRAAGDTVDGSGFFEHPLIKFIEEFGGLLSKSAAKKTRAWKHGADQYDQARPLSHPTHNRIYQGRTSPDEMATAAWRAGLLPDGYAHTLFDRINEISKNGSKLPASEPVPPHIVEQDKVMAAIQPTPKGKTVPVGEVTTMKGPGGELLKVTANPDSDGQTVRIHNKVQFDVPADMPVNARKVTQRAEKPGNDPFAPEPAEPTPAAPKLAEGEKGTGDLLKKVENQPFNLAGETVVDHERVAAERAAAATAAEEAKAATAKAQGDLFAGERAPQPTPHHPPEAGTGGVPVGRDAIGAARAGSLFSRIAGLLGSTKPAQVGKGGLQLAHELISLYCEPIVQRIARLGGGIQTDILNISSRAKRLMGSLTHNGLDDALTAAGKLNKSTTWMSGVKEQPNGIGYSNMQAAIEGNIANVPLEHRPLALLIRKANLAIGKLAGVDMGKMQRNMTETGIDIVLTRGEPLNRLAAELAAKNPVEAASLLADFRRKGVMGVDADGKPTPITTPTEAVLHKFYALKVAMESPGASAVQVHKINQDFRRLFPVFPTHIDLPGNGFVEIIHSTPTGYLRNASARTASAVAFREVFPMDSANLGHARQLFLHKAGGHGADFDTAMRALQGLPQPVPGWTKPTNPAVMAMRSMFDAVMHVMSKAVLTGNAIVNIPETLFGGSAQYLGFKAHWQGLLKHRQMYNAMEVAGDVNRYFYDNSFNPNAPGRSIARIVGNAFTKLSMSQVLNEVQEATAGAAARLVANQIRGAGKALTPWQKSRLPHTLEAMGFSEKEAAALMAGDEALLSRFESGAAPYMNAGNMTGADGSRAYNNRLFNTLFRFQSYPMMKLNQLRASWGHLADVIEREGGVMHRAGGRLAFNKEVLYASEIVARQAFGTTAQGALTAMITALAFGGIEGLKLKWKDAQDSPLGFALDSALAAVGGPFYLIVRGMERAGRSEVANQITAAMFPLSMTKELWDVTTGGGQYADLKPADRMDKFIFERLPGGKIIQQALCISGLSTINADLKADTRAFNQWKGQTMGWRDMRVGRWEDTNATFRAGMKQAMTAIQRGESILPGLLQATSNTGRVVTYNQLAASIRSRTLLRNLDGGALTEEQVTSLIGKIGNEAYRRLAYYDAKLNVVASALADMGNVPASVKTDIHAMTARATEMAGDRSRVQNQIELSDYNREKKAHIARSMQEFMAGRK